MWAHKAYSPHILPAHTAGVAQLLPQPLQSPPTGIDEGHSAQLPSCMSPVVIKNMAFLIKCNGRTRRSHKA